jgi:glycerate kinase
MNNPWPPARVLVAPDIFKGTLSSDEAARAIVRGLRRAWPRTHFTRQTIADGGEGFAANLVKATHGKLHRCKTLDAAGRPCTAVWGMLGNGRTAVFDLAAASGLAQLPEHLRDPARTSTSGSGLLMRRALVAGASRLIVGLGGSATNDGGIGLAHAFGYRFVDARGEEIPATGAGLSLLARIVAPRALPRVRIVVATDVDNPLYGRNGAAWQFARQKGADDAMIAALDRGLRHLAAAVKRDLGKDLAHEPGAGAAGGCGFGLMTFFGAKRAAGFDVLREQIGLDALVRGHDLIVTGEGAFDRTSFAGKAPFRLAGLAAAANVPIWGIFGRIDALRRRLPFARTAALVAADAAFAADADHAHKLEQAAFALALQAGS